MKKKTLLDLEDFIYEFYGEENKELSVAVLTTILGVFVGIKPAGLLTNDVMNNGDVLLDGGKFVDFLSDLGVYILIGENRISHEGEPYMTKAEENEIYDNDLDVISLTGDAPDINDLDIEKLDVSKLGLDGGEVRKFNLECLGNYRGGEFLYISFQKRICRELKLAYEQMMNSMRNGFVMDGKEDEWTVATFKIGDLLGYPETAIIEYVSKNKNELYINNEEHLARIRRNRYYAHSEVFEDAEFKEYDLPMNLAIKKYLPRTVTIMAADSTKRWLD